MPATANPVATKAASVMCSVCWNAIGLAIAATGSMFVRRPFARSNPVGAFIHALAITTKIPESVPLTATRMPDARCARGEIRFHP